jgi:hypothetical protein
MALLAVLAGCVVMRGDPELAASPYPQERHTTTVLPMQVFRDGDSLEIVNATARSYRDIDVWVNQRYVRRVATLPAGARLRLSLPEFIDERGDRFPSAGLFRVRETIPVRLVEIATAEGPMYGLITIRAEEVRRQASGF